MRVALIAALLLVACGDSRPPDAPTAVGIASVPGSMPSFPPLERRVPPSIVLDELKLAVNGEEVELPWRVTTLHRLFGEPTRLLHMMSEVHVYDDLGVVLFEGTGSGVVSSVCVFYAPKEYKFSPQTMFAGALRVRGVDVDGHTTPSTIVERAPLKWEGEYKGSRSARYDGGSIDIARNEETDALEYVRVYVRSAE